ncbi:asparaginase [Tepidibacter aestuarii]|uniref:asparaginase n=1 Tax=Tepidibacter aestuarii TaxID=2925782 RepID=UPI0020BFD8C9|nr:asparaginase [Tepidibacter aestuarii]
MNITKLVDVYRGRKVESSHFGHVVVVNSNGKLLYSAGDPNRITYARSSIKPIQVIPVIETGTANKYRLSNDELALMCASHSGEPQHTNKVLEILDRNGMEENMLKCGTHIPRGKNVYENLIVKGKKLTPVYSNCSGKHTGMLLTAKHMGETIENYYEINHPVQQRILNVISQMTSCRIEDIEIGIDGCGVPVHSLPLYNLAYAFARLACPENFGLKRAKACKRITTAMTEYPEMVGGTGRFCTDFMKATNGRFVGKAGAEAVYAIGDKDTGIGIAIKIEDGNFRAVYPTAVEVLKQLNMIKKEELEKLKDHYTPKIYNNRKEEVGKIITSFNLQKH